jgi:cytoskeletal protein RodZ
MKESVGQQLQQAREAQKLSLEQVSQATHMRIHNLRALEAGEFDKLASATQLRGFLRAYASYLKIDPEPLLAGIDQVAELPATELTPTPPISNGQPLPPSSERYQHAQETLAGLGQTLRTQRELLGLSLDEIVRYTHLRRHYLEALEAGNLEGLPSPVQGRGMLNNYATFLGLDPEPLLLQFAEALQARLASRQNASLEPPSRPARRKRPMPLLLRRILSPDVLIGLTFAIFLVAFLSWGAVRIFSLRAGETPSPTAPSIAEVLLSTPTQTLASVPLTTSSSPSSTLQVLPPIQIDAGTATPAELPTGLAPGVQVYVTVQQRAWIRAMVDGKLEFEGRVLPGSAYPFVGKDLVELLVSNGAGLRIFFNQQDLGPLGSYGQVVNLIFTRQGVLTPTPTITRTPTPTSRFTPTPPVIPSTPTVPSLP